VNVTVESVALLLRIRDTSSSNLETESDHSGRDFSSYSSLPRGLNFGIDTDYWLGDRGVGVRVPLGARIFTSPCRPHWLWSPLNFLLSPEVKRPGLETDHSPPTSADVKKTRVYSSTPPYAFMVKHRDNFNFFYLTRPQILFLEDSYL
jgi:hypothetical protein